MKYKHKIVTSGDIIELYTYEKEVCTGKDKDGKREENNGRRGDGLKWVEEDKKRYRTETLQKAKKQLRREINANVDQWQEKTKFITLTYSENMKDVKESNYNFKKFIQRLNYKMDLKLKYSCVVEFQKRGAVHYHLLAYNLPFIENSKLAEIWGHGFVQVKNIDSIDNVGAYVTKYMSKDNDDERLRGLKCYFSSRGLYKPTEQILDKEKFESVKGALEQFETYSAEFDTDWLGKIKYSQININRL
ncbi:Rep protein [Paraliobacillus quinghaiensis]|uniref:Rep protein n=1 Tax=Paraliobacillus quinghaiensis TaxID=470815 RepID=A0A917TXT1_9BACI|nr:hypothetical protein [Paraliobacillus quinghaiensis]GGM43726.1 Rep protein [Paraliobacillus quinghaiensis]